jgi:hypothetical protein
MARQPAWRAKQAANGRRQHHRISASSTVELSSIAWRSIGIRSKKKTAPRMVTEWMAWRLGANRAHRQEQRQSGVRSVIAWYQKRASARLVVEHHHAW